MRIFRSLEFLLPGKRIRIFVDTLVSYLNRKQPLILNIIISSSNKNKRKFQEVIKHNLSIYRDSGRSIRKRRKLYETVQDLLRVVVDQKGICY
jgi:hypothetical protein